MTIDELYERCVEMAKTTSSPLTNRFMHETLVLCCGEALKNSDTGFGNLFSQVDYLSKQCGMKAAERREVQQMRRHSNHSETLSQEEWLQDVRALALFVSAVFKTGIPGELLRLLPLSPIASSPKCSHLGIASHIRCIVDRWDAQTIYADTPDGENIEVEYREHEYLRKMLRRGLQLNLLDSHVEKKRNTRITPGLVVVEPDFLVDISAVAHCFQANYGHHPLLYTTDRLRPRHNSQAILLGNFAGAALDDIINHQEYNLGDTMSAFFSKQALQFATCEDFDSQQFMSDARRQSDNIREAVTALFGAYDRSKALLEPSFVCERLGLQGRVDLMTSDMRLLVEQKSGRNYMIERSADSRSQQPSATVARLFKEEHYVQLLLYYGILRYNFGRSDSQTDIRLLYSHYPAAQGLLYVNFYRELFREAIRLRNQIVATEVLIANEGFSRITPLLTPAVVYRDADRDSFFHRYIEPPIESLRTQLSSLQPTELAYFHRMMTFVYREQLLQKVGRQEGLGSACSDLWNMPLSEKLETGNILLSEGEPSPTLNFRRGDIVYLYNYDEKPDVRKAILYKGTLEQIDSSGIKVKLNEGLSADTVMHQGKWAIEHAYSDQNTTSSIKSLYLFMTASKEKRTLLLGGRPPRHDSSQQLSRSYHPHYDEVLLRAKQARDYFLLVGPPGTGKTSMALRFLVEEELTSLPSLGSPIAPSSQLPHASILLMAYTNRAVDEICAMLEAAGHDYMRIASAAACDPRFNGHLLEADIGSRPKLADLRRRISETQIIVGTTSMIQARPFILRLKHFSLCIVDEASQLLEPGLVGLLTTDRIDRFILIGDHKQLPAVVQQSPQESRVADPLLTAIGISDCRMSLFERLLRWEQQQGRIKFTGILRRQGRMHPDIAAFPNALFYPDDHLEPVPLQHQTDTSLHYDLPSEDNTDDILKQRRVVFIPSASSPQATDKANPAEAHIVADLLRRIYRFYGPRFNPDTSVGVIVPYRNQIAMIRHEIVQLGLPQLEKISIDTVERYQGSQRDVIIYSFTISRPYQLDFLTSTCFEEGGRTIDRKLNVAITRARKQMLMTGNKEILKLNSIFSEIIARYEEKIY